MKAAFRTQKKVKLISAHNHHHLRWTLKGISSLIKLKTALKGYRVGVVAPDQCASRTIALATEMELNAMGPVHAQGARTPYSYPRGSNMSWAQ